MNNTNKPIRLLFVCLGNICRSPMAHGIFEHKVKQNNLEDKIIVDSAGTGDWHVGHAPDIRSQEEAKNQGLDLSLLRARQVDVGDFYCSHIILAMDEYNLYDLERLEPGDFEGQLDLFLPFCGSETQNVADPYEGGQQGFAEMYTIINQACDVLLEKVIQKQR